tara:strand:- start:6127 stop:7164 length:1038 start_codon:yes stop_codon:yes gene_type:complete
MSENSCVYLTEELQPQYQEFVENHPEAMFYHTLKYRELITRLLGHEENYLVTLDSDNKIQAILPLMIKTGSIGAVVNSLPFYGSNGCILANDDESFNATLDFYNTHFAENKDIASTTIITNPLDSRDTSDKFIHNIKDFRIGQFTKIEYSENHDEQLMTSFHHKTRNMVRKAQKLNIHVKIDNDKTDFLYETHLQNLTAIGGRPKVKLFFDLYTDVYEANTDYKIYVAEENGVTIAALLLFYYNNTVEYYSPVIVEEHRNKQPLSLLILEAMIDASKAGYKKWNWGGTWASQEGVYRFKKRWGTEDTEYFYYTQINNAEVYSCTPEKLLSEYPDTFVIPFQHLKS